MAKKNLSTPRKVKKTPTAIRRSGDDYQDLVALDILIHWLECPSEYKWVKVEADGMGSLDDVTALKSNNDIIAKQVKYSSNARELDNAWTWTQLLRREGKTNKSRSLLKKWYDTVQTISNEHTIGQVAVVTNRYLSNEINDFMEGTHVNLSRVPKGIQKTIAGHLGDATLTRAFFSQFEFLVEQREYDLYRDKLLERFFRLGGTKAGFQNLQEVLRGWIRDSKTPNPGRHIYLYDIRKASEWRTPKPLDEEFHVPIEYIPPEPEFINSIFQRDRSTAIYGTPGSGKSTFLSYITAKRKEQRKPVIRHHFFLSTTDKTARLRLVADRVVEALISELQKEYPEAVSTTSTFNPSIETFHSYLVEAGRYFHHIGSELYLIIDGLDHVWRDMESMKELDLLLGHIFPIPEGVVFIIGTQRLQESIFPSSLLNNLPYNSWVELPTLNEQQIRQWTDFFPEVPIPKKMPVAKALEKKSGGNPLILNYIFNYLRNQRTEITAENITNIQWDISGPDVAKYYKQLLQKLTSQGKEILFLLTAAELPWEKGWIADCLHRRPLSDNFKAIDEIAFLLKDSEDGLSFFHNSLSVFISQDEGYSLYENRLLQATIDWLRIAAPEHIRWKYLWKYETLLGHTKGFEFEITRAWVIESIASGKPYDSINGLLSDAINILLQKEQLAKALHLSHLWTYFNTAIDEDLELRSPFLFSRLLYAEAYGFNNSLKTIEKEISTLSARELLSLSRFAVHTKNESLQEVLLSAARNIQGYFYLPLKEDQLNQWSEDWKPVLKLGLLLRREFLNQTTLQSLKDCERLEDWILLYLQEQTKFLRINEVLTAFRHPSLSQFGTYFEMAIAKTSLMQCLETDELHSIFNLSKEPLPAIYEYIHKNSDYKFTGVDFKIEDILTLRWTDLWRKPFLVEYFLAHTFWCFIANELWGRSKTNRKWVRQFTDRQEWQYKLLYQLYTSAVNISKDISVEKPISFNAIYAQLEPLPIPKYNHDDREYVKAIKNIAMEIAILLPRITSSAKKSPVLQLKIKEVYRSSYFDLWQFIYLVNSHSIVVLQSTIEEILSLAEAKVREEIEELPYKVEKYSALSEMAFLYNKKELGTEYLKMGISCSIGYIWRKDISMALTIRCLNSLFSTDPVASTMLIKRLIPAILEISNYTDGKETSHLIPSTAWLLKEKAPELYPAYIDYLKKNNYEAYREAVFSKPEKEPSSDRPFDTAIQDIKIHLKGNGNDERGFELLCNRYFDRGLWTPWSYREETQEYWALLKQYYPNRWKEFIMRTIGRRRGEEGGTLGISLWALPKIIQFLIKFEQSKLAVALVESAVASVLELVSPLTLPIIYLNE